MTCSCLLFKRNKGLFAARIQLLILMIVPWGTMIDCTLYLWLPIFFLVLVAKIWGLTYKKWWPGSGNISLLSLIWWGKKTKRKVFFCPDMGFYWREEYTLFLFFIFVFFWEMRLFGHAYTPCTYILPPIFCLITYFIITFKIWRRKFLSFYKHSNIFLVIKTEQFLLMTPDHSLAWTWWHPGWLFGFLSYSKWLGRRPPRWVSPGLPPNPPLFFFFFYFFFFLP